MKQISIVKRSDVGHGTALHYALDWSYGRNALCGQAMRSTAKEWETTYKRVCGTCVRIMASMVEKGHAEALKMITFTAGDVVEYQGSGDDDPNTVGVVLAVDGQKVTVQWDGGDIADMYVGRLVHFTRTIEAAHAEALEIAKDRLDIADFDEEAVYARAGQGQTGRDELIGRAYACGFSDSQVLADTDTLRVLVEAAEREDLREQGRALGLTESMLLSDTGELRRLIETCDK